MASKEQAEAARANARWVRGFGPEAKAKEAVWYPIKVDGIAKEVICKTKDGRFTRELQDDILETISKSNSHEGFVVKAMKVHLLSKESDSPHCSIAMYLESWFAVQQLLAEGVFLIRPNVAGTSRFIKQKQPLRCYNCNQYGHMQGKCIAKPTCGNCAAQH